MKNTTDQQERLRALDPGRSFIIQAPAGSGKTTLLTQRFLTLLSSIQAPEEILAITFTKKAAAEMQSRILDALEKNDSDLAQKALAQDKSHHWQLLKNPNRLRIQTIDSLCFSLANHMPILSQFGGQPILASDNEFENLYQQAANNTLNQIRHSEYSEHLKTLLLHLDNRFNAVSSLLVNMLKKRDQWINLIFHVKNADDGILSLQIGLEAIQDDAIEKCRETIPVEWTNEILTLGRYAANYVEKSPISYCGDLADAPNTKKEWLGIAELLLTSENDWRKTRWRKIATIHIGFPPPKDAKNSSEKNFSAEMKNRFESLLSKLTSQTDFLNALIALRLTPEIIYAEQQKNILESLLHILPVCIANLKLLFRQTGTVDYIEIAQAANVALGEPENPTDLSLILDYKIKHILVDEFQDTSISQFKLLEKLTAGWEQNDGKTLFFVGDPMQSIYRFRNAEVGLFLRAQKEGINNIDLEKITLTTNFRSEKNIVHWINNTFENIFPTVEDIPAGAVKYSPSTPYHDDPITTPLSRNSVMSSSRDLHPKWVPIAGSRKNFNLDTAGKPRYDGEGNVHFHAEIESMIPIIQKRNQNESLAILVRARSHLEKIIPLLRQHQIDYQAVEIDSLSEKPCIQDLLSLTKALLHPADRLSWLSLLRAPWCGLTLKSLYQIANTDPEKTIYESLNIPLENLDDQKRLTSFKNTIENAFCTRFDFSLREWIETTWENLDGPFCLIPDRESLEDVQLFFNELEKCDIKNIALLESKVRAMFSNKNSSDSNAIQLMTIHKAKGLEFDIVILPGLERTSRPSEKQLMLWMERPRTHFENDLILAPIKPFKETEDDSITRYLKFEEIQKSKYESQRLLYVAATRAKKQLHLIAEMKNKNAASNSFLSMISSQFAHQNQSASNCKIIETLPTENKRMLRRLKTIIENKNDAAPIIPQYFSHTESFGQQQIGTLVHHILQQIANDGLTKWSIERLKLSKNAIKNTLLRSGISNENLNFATEKVLFAVTNTLNDEKGRWILSRHQNAESELPITLLENNKPKNYIIDRTFVDDNETRWIIDFKCTEHSSDRNLVIEQYREQLDQYKNIIHQLYPAETITLAIYFPFLAEIMTF